MDPRTPLSTRGDAGGASFSIASIIAIICAIASFFLAGFTGLVLAIVAIIAGAIGAMIALSPTRRGGIMSVFAIGAGLLAVVVSIFKIVSYLF